MSEDFCGYYLKLFAILRSQQLFNEGDSPHLFAWFSSTLNKKTNSDKLQFLSLLSAVSCVTESIVPGHVTHSAILNLEGEANSSARKETGQGNAIATFSPLTRQSNGPRLVTLFAKRNEVSKRATFSLPIVYDSNKKSLSEFAEIYTALLVSSIVSVVGPRVLSEQTDYSIWEQRVTIDALKSICAFLSTSFIPIVSIQSVSKALQSTIEEGVQQIQEAKETAFKSFTRAATGSHYQPPFRSSQKTPNSFSPTFFSRKSPSRESRTQVTRPSVYGELSLLERAAERALDTHEKDLGPQIDVFSATLGTLQETTLNNSHILQVEEQHNISFDIKESRNTSHWIVFSAALLYAQDSPPFLLAHTSRALPHIETFEWSVLRSVEAVLIAKKEELKFAFKNSSSGAGLSFPVFLPTQSNLDHLTNTSTDEVNASDIKHHGEEALLRSPLKYNLQIILHWRPVVSLNHSMALLQSQSPLSNDAKEVDENFVVTLLLIASERSEGDVHENIDISLRKNIALILLSTAGTLAASESLSLLARASSTLARSESGSGEILESMRA